MILKSATQKDVRATTCYAFKISKRVDAFYNLKSEVFNMQQ